MKRFGFLCAFLLATGCKPAPQIDCRDIYEGLDACVDEAAERSSPFSWDQCLPYSEPIVITGRYATDFEWNVFLEGPFGDQTDPWKFEYFAPKLSWSDEIHLPRVEDENGNKLATLYEVTFKGRRPLCLALPNESWIIADEIISKKVIETRTSDFP